MFVLSLFFSLFSSPLFSSYLSLLSSFLFLSLSCSPPFFYFCLSAVPSVTNGVNSGVLINRQHSRATHRPAFRLRLDHVSFSGPSSATSPNTRPATLFPLPAEKQLRDHPLAILLLLNRRWFVAKIFVGVGQVPSPPYGLISDTSCLEEAARAARQPPDHVRREIVDWHHSSETEPQGASSPLEALCCINLRMVPALRQ